MTLVCVGGMLLGLLFSLYVIPFDVVRLQYWICGALLIWLFVLFLRSRIYRFLFIMFFLVVSVGFSFSLGYVFDKVLFSGDKCQNIQPFQRLMSFLNQC